MNTLNLTTRSNRTRRPFRAPRLLMKIRRRASIAALAISWTLAGAVAPARAADILTVSPQTLTVAPGGFGTATVRWPAFTPVGLTTSFVAGVSFNFVPTGGVNFTATMTVSVAAGVTPATYEVTIAAIDPEGGGVQDTVIFTLIVAAPTRTPTPTNTSTPTPTNTPTPTAPVLACGNGVLDPGELCDDGNNEPFDGCSPWCCSEADPSVAMTFEEVFAAIVCDLGAIENDLSDPALGSRVAAKLDRRVDGTRRIADRGATALDAGKISRACKSFARAAKRFAPFGPAVDKLVIAGAIDPTLATTLTAKQASALNALNEMPRILSAQLPEGETSDVLSDGRAAAKLQAAGCTSCMALDPNTKEPLPELRLVPKVKQKDLTLTAGSTRCTKEEALQAALDEIAVKCTILELVPDRFICDGKCPVKNPNETCQITTTTEKRDGVISKCKKVAVVPELGCPKNVKMAWNCTWTGPQFNCSCRCRP